MARRESFRDRALVLRTYDFAEADRIVVLLTRDHGIVRAVAKGVRRARSRFGSRVQLFVDLDVNLYAGRNLATITAADTVTYFGSGIIERYETYAAACAVLESAERIAPAETGADPYLYTAVCTTLARLQRAPDPDLVLIAFLLQAMGHAGWALSLFNCASCGARGPHHAFHPGAGGAVCVHCRPPGAAEVDPQVLHLMWLLAQDSLDAARELIATSAAGPSLLDAAHRLTATHVRWHLERTVRAFDVFSRG